MTETIEAGMANPTNRILWFVLVLSQGLYVLAASLVPAVDMDGELVPTLGGILALMAIGVAVGSAAFRKKAIVEPIQSGKLDPTTREGLARAFTPFILNLVLSEAVAIWGLVLSLISGDLGWVVGFVAGGLALMWYHRPTSADFVPPPRADVGRPAPIA